MHMNRCTKFISDAASPFFQR